MKKAGYRIFRLKPFGNTKYYDGFVLDPSGLSGGGWVNADGTFPDMKTAEAITSAAMQENPGDEFVILPVYKASGH